MRRVALFICILLTSACGVKKPAAKEPKPPKQDDFRARRIPMMSSISLNPNQYLGLIVTVTIKNPTEKLWCLDEIVVEWGDDQPPSRRGARCSGPYSESLPTDEDRIDQFYTFRHNFTAGGKYEIRVLAMRGGKIVAKKDLSALHVMKDGYVPGMINPWRNSLYPR